ncbi:RNA polymerase-associated protein [Allopseudospirillum japonicum]|uniref:RNA polymerase-associated protein n=1 Tax=Allopseudospirillum japonicum TaxID=64971 RepID=A0A1H6QMP5_9GAMM|nr:stringent starvation protein SspA [Allopseudospirillum japonicum]SEI40710.1 RNA polymerase-associated protein [Allopseudospirillum japonicum]
MGVVAKRSSMTFYSNGEDHYSHRVRIVLAEKGVAVDILDINPANKPEELAELNPYNSLPTLVDRELVLYASNIMMEYLDERFPHPPLLPVYPVARAESRLWVYRIDNEWSPLVDTIMAGEDAKAIDAARKRLKEDFTAIAPIFAEKPYFMSDEFSLTDCCMAAILWRLPRLGIELPEKSTRYLQEYMGRLFERDSFRESLSETEREMR